MSTPVIHMHAGHGTTMCGAPRRHTLSYATDDVLLVACAECKSMRDFTAALDNAIQHAQWQKNDLDARISALDQLKEKGGA